MRDSTKINDNEITLQACLIENPDGVVNCLDKIRPNYFHNSVNQRIYIAIVDLFSSNNSLDFDSIKSKLKKAEDRTNFLIVSKKSFTVNKESIDLFIESVRQEAQLSKVIELGRTLANIASLEETSAEKAIDLAEQGILDIVSKYTTSDIVTSSDAATEFVEYFKLRQNPDTDAISIMSGLDRLDDMTNGFQPGQFIVVMGKTGNGKSAFSTHIALHNAIKKDIGTLMFSMEMSRLELMSRIFAYYGNIPMGLFKRREKLPEKYDGNFPDVINGVKNLPIHICDQSQMTVGGIHALAKKTKIKNKNLGLVIVDYIGLVSAEKGGNREQEVASISRGLKCLAMSLKIPVIGISQVNENENARDSRAIEHDADIIITVNTESDDNGGGGWNEIKPAKIVVKKQRNGPTGSLVATFVGDKQMFVDKNVEEYIHEMRR